ncbi:MAG: hypothetical protein ACYS9Y_12800 [Planctomycetota bacterium]|jgi:hypothetical protein
MTETDVCNIALGKVGGAGDQASGSGLIASINGTDRVSKRCKTFFPRVRRRVLEDLVALRTPPKEALIFTDMGTEVTPTIEMGGWDYAFNVPNNTIAVIRQIDEEFATVKTSITHKIEEYPFQIRWQGTTRILFTNDLTNTDIDSAFIERVFDQTNVNTWSEAFVDAVATLLGAELVPTVGAVDEKRQSLLAEYKTISLPNVGAAIQSQDDDFKREVSDYKGGRTETLSTP